MIVSYNWLKDYLNEDIPTPNELADLLTFHSFEIEAVTPVGDDVAIDIKILPDRGSDCLSHRGVAREIATLLNRPLVQDPLANKPKFPPTTEIKISIEDTTACPRFTASLVKGIKVGPSPDWLVKRLATLGMRSINNIVDATNYVMYALGQPLHAYDATKFTRGPAGWQFVIRPALAGEPVALLSEGGKAEERIITLKGGETLIVDGTSKTAVGLAGVKGGDFAAVDQSTTDIIIEAAHFNPSLTRRTARSVGIAIDASKRFENEPSRELPLYAQGEIIKLITDIAGGNFVGLVDNYPAPSVRAKVEVDPGHVNALLGLSLTTEEVVGIIERLGAVVERASGHLICTGPFERNDLNLEADYIDEVGRIYGYSHVASVVPAPTTLAEINKQHYYSERIRNFLVARGFSEVITSSFREKDQIELLNALASDKGYLRSKLAPNLAEVLNRNVAYQDLLGTSDTRVFEIGTVFIKEDGKVIEHSALGLGFRSKVSNYVPKDDAFLSDIVVELEALLGTSLKFVKDKGVFELNLSAAVADLPPPTAYDSVPRSQAIVYQPFSIFPSISRDIAMWVAEGTAEEEVMTTLNQVAGPLRVRTTHIDTFTKDGRTSLAFRLVFQASNRTLTDEEINTVMNEVYATAVTRGWETR